MKSDNLRIHYREGLFYGSYGCKEHPNLQVLGQLLSNKDTKYLGFLILNLVLVLNVVDN